MKFPEKAYRVAVNGLARGIRFLMRSNGIKGHFCIGPDNTFFEIDGIRFEYHYPAFGVSGNIDSGGSTEPQTRAKLMEYLSGPASVLYDVGAHEGLFSLDAKTRNPAAIVHAFEPQAAALFKNIKINGFEIAVHEVAVGEAAGTVSMTTDQRSSNFVTGEGGPIPVIRLDDLTDLPPPSAIKLDIEGFELSALRGARSLLMRHRPVVVMEINHCFLRYNSSLKPLYELMSSLGYSFNRLASGKLHEITERTDTPDALPRSAEDNYWWVARS